jgi:DNA-binding transcriptional MerR regulator/methylmalonyl-CoA mutase cobalamin-binding subunit
MSVEYVDKTWTKDILLTKVEAVPGFLGKMVLPRTIRNTGKRCTVQQGIEKPSDGHPISVVVRRTGLTQDILRAWEKRYGAVVPLRTATGRRLYTEDQVAKLRLLKQLVDGGRRISDVADLDLEDLQALADEDASEAVAPARLSPKLAGGGHLAACVDALERLDRRGLERALDAASVSLSRPRLRAEVIVPLIVMMGQRWREGVWRVVHEHLGSAVLRSFLWSMWRRSELGTGAPSLVVATPAGQQHELGALLAAGVAADVGWQVVYLGADLPAEEIAAAVEASGATAVLLSLVYPLGDTELLHELQRLRQLVGPDLLMVAGGRAVTGIREELAASGIGFAEDLDALASMLAVKEP